MQISKKIFLLGIGLLLKNLCIANTIDLECHYRATTSGDIIKKIKEKPDSLLSQVVPQLKENGISKEEKKIWLSIDTDRKSVTMNLIDKAFFLGNLPTVVDIYLDKIFIDGNYLNPFNQTQRGTSLIIDRKTGEFDGRRFATDNSLSPDVKMGEVMYTMFGTCLPKPIERLF